VISELIGRVVGTDFESVALTVGVW
jgi:hypothetical protein